MQLENESKCPIYLMWQNYRISVNCTRDDHGKVIKHLLCLISFEANSKLPFDGVVKVKKLKTNQLCRHNKSNIVAYLAYERTPANCTIGG